MKYSLIFLFCVGTVFIMKAQEVIYRKDDSTAKAKVHEVLNPPVEIPDSTRKKPALTRPAKNVVFAELGGNGGFYSLNYERRFHLKPLLSISARLGYSDIPAKSGGGGITFNKFYNYQTIPVSVSLLFGKDRMLEIGLGYTPVFITENRLLYDFNNYTGLMIGYRYQKETGGFFFKCGLAFAVSVDPYRDKNFPIPYLAWGYAF